MVLRLPSDDVGAADDSQNANPAALARIDHWRQAR
jgi:hypothetical protein